MNRVVQKAAAVFVLMSVSLLAGCLGGDGDLDDMEFALEFDPDWALNALPFGDGHDHYERDHHRNLTTPNFEIIGYDPLTSPYYGTTPGGYMCGHATDTEDGRRLAITESRSDVGFAIADVTDPTAPRWIGELVMRYTHNYDVAVLPDGKHVVLATSSHYENRIAEDLPVSQTPEDETVLFWRSACSGETVPVQASGHVDPVPRPMSLILVNIEDPEQPVIVDQHPLMGSGHSVYPTLIDGEILMLVTTARAPRPGSVLLPENPYSLLPEDPTGNSQMGGYEFYRLLATPAGERLELLSIYKPPGNEPLEVGPRGHDGWIEKHPQTGDLLAYLAGGDRFIILDLGDLRNPQEISRWSDNVEGRGGYSANLHSVYPMPQPINGRYYTLLGPEFGGHPDLHPSGILWALDTTDPTDVFEAGAWTLPHDVEWNGTYMFSNHYFAALNETAFISMYHGGAWAIDLSTLGLADFVLLPAVGVFMPDIDPPSEPARPQRWAPNLQEVEVFADGVMVSFDANAGIVVFRYDEDQPGPAPEPWPIEPVRDVEVTDGRALLHR